MNFGVNTVIFQDGKIALTKREDFEVWCLPGGQIDPGESVAEAAIRETREETGLEVRLTRMVGLYSVLTGPIQMHVACFAAEVQGGVLAFQPEEAVDIGWFDPANLPEPFLWWHRQRVQDTLNGVTGAVWKQEAATNPDFQNLSRAELYRLRDESGLSRVEFYLKYMHSPEMSLTREVG